MTEVRIPKHIMRYEDAALGCKYDLDGESLYSVKWYKDGFEFYRYVPRDKPPGQIFPLPGVDVDVRIQIYPNIISDTDTFSIYSNYDSNFKELSCILKL